MTTLPDSTPELHRHGKRTRGKHHGSAPAPAANRKTESMAELAKEIIRQQWPMRHHPDPLRRAQSRTLIRAHIHLLRLWQEKPSPVAA